MGAGRGVRLAAGGHCMVVEKCEGLSLGGLGAVSRGEGTGRHQTEMRYGGVWEKQRVRGGER